MILWTGEISRSIRGIYWVRSNYGMEQQLLGKELVLGNGSRDHYTAGAIALLRYTKDMSINISYHDETSKEGVFGLF